MYLLDTNCLSELRRISAGRADPNVAAWAAFVPPSAMFLSVVSIFEVQSGISRVAKRDPAKAEGLLAWLEDRVLSSFEQRVLPIDTQIARVAGRLAGRDTIETADVLIAATASVHDLTLVTRNTSDFKRTGVALLNPWRKLTP